MVRSPFHWNTELSEKVNIPLAACAQVAYVTHKLSNAADYTAETLSSKLDDTTITLAKSGL